MLHTGGCSGSPLPLEARRGSARTNGVHLVVSMLIPKTISKILCIVIVGITMAASSHYVEKVFSCLIILLKLEIIFSF